MLTADFAETPLDLEADLFRCALDSLLAHIAILDEHGAILEVNTAWNRFALHNGLEADACGPGANYLTVCERATGPCSEEALVTAEGIREVIAGQCDHFYLEYPCHSPDEQRWFSVRVTHFETEGRLRVVVTHDNITRRKLAELRLQEANRLLEVQAATDGLTGIANRRSFDRVLRQEWRRHKHEQTCLTVAMIDIDCFKQYNDSQGHQAGDECLKAVAGAIQRGLAGPDSFVARYGGEEFAVILPRTDDAGAARVLPEVLRHVRQLRIPHPATTVERGVITISLGQASAVPGQRGGMAEFLRAADQALYQAKAQGRDRLAASTWPP
jgi:diguanylate cyclase (GGDEF)-like protein